MLQILNIGSRRHGILYLDAYAGRMNGYMLVKGNSIISMQSCGSVKQPLFSIIQGHTHIVSDLFGR